MNIYDDGDLVHVTGTFADEAGAPITPDDIFLEFRFGPDGTVTQRQYGEAGIVMTNDSPGVYSDMIDTTGQGGKTCHYSFYSTGDGQAAGKKRFQVGRRDPA